MAFPPFRPQLSLGRIQSYIGDVGGNLNLDWCLWVRNLWQSELRLVSMDPELLLQSVVSSLKVSSFAPFLTGIGSCGDNVQAWGVKKTKA